MVTILTKKDGEGIHSLRWTLLITYVCIGLLPLLLFSNVVFKTTEKYFIEERKKELLSQANVVSGHISISGYLFDQDRQSAFDDDIEQTSIQGGFRIIVTDSTGTVINDSNGTDIGKTYLIPEVIEALDNKDVAKVQKNGTIYAAVSIMDSNSNRIGAVLISALSNDLTDTVAQIKKQAYILLTFIVLLVLTIIISFSQLLIQPLNKMLSVIKKLSNGHLDQRIPINEYSHDEISQVARAVNNMTDKLEQVEITRHNFVSNVSHELKTPLSSIKVLSESVLLEEDVPKEVYVEFLQDINSEVDRMTEIINDLLTLVRLDQKEIPISFVPTNLNNLIGIIIKRLTPLARIKDITLEFDSLKEVEADVDSTKLTLAVSNLVENGVKYTPEGGRVSVSIDADHQNAFITVTDSGLGIADDEMNKIFDRFYRIDKTRDRETGGTGLGLSITHSTILLHNGSIKVTSRENEGSTFVVRIPLHQNS